MSNGNWVRVTSNGRDVTKRDSDTLIVNWTITVNDDVQNTMTFSNPISNEGRDVIVKRIVGRVRKDLPNILNAPNTPKRSKTNLRKPSRVEWRRIVNV